MADKVVGLDFGTRAIKLVTVEKGEPPVVTSVDEEPIPLDHDPYLEQEGFDPSEEDEGVSDEETDASTQDEPSASDAEAEPDVEGSANDWEADFDTSFEWGEALGRLLARNDFDDSSECSTFLPEGRAIGIRVDVPFHDESKVEDVLPNLLEDRLPVEQDEVVYDFRVVTPEHADQHEALVAIGRNDDIRWFLDRLDECDVDPAVLGIPELMLRYVLEPVVSDGETAALVDVGHQFSRLVVAGDEALLSKSLQVGGENITRKIADKLELSLEQAESHKIERATAHPAAETATRQARATSEAVRLGLRPLIRDLRRNFQSLYATDGIELDRIYLCGGTSRLDGLESYLENQFDLPVERLPLKSALSYRTVGESAAPESALATAAALQMTRDRAERESLNLRKDQFAYQGRSSYIRRQLRNYGIAAAVLVMLFFGTLFARQYMLQQRKAALENSLASQTKQVFGKSVQDPKVVRNIAQGEQASGRAFVPKMSAYQLYHEMISRISEDTELELNRINVDTDRSIVQMKGTTSSPQAVSQVVRDLKTLECLEAINKKPVRVQNENKARFELEITSGCS